MSAIELSGVGKRFIQTAKRPSIIEAIARRNAGRQQEFWALRDINLTCDAGETLAIIGRNGSGKTTLLRLLTGVSAPTEGRVRVVGRVAPLIGIGVGFNPELTGRENIYVNGQLLGLTRAEVDERIDDIIAFSEMADFVETAVKYYSSGMFLRLAFSVAAHTDPDIFVIDEVLAVGDAAFQLKCLTLMRAAQARGATIVIVTHNLQMAHDLAPRAVLLSRGELVYDGDVEIALGEYQKVMQSEDSDYVDDASGRLEVGNASLHAGNAEIEVELLNADGVPTRTFATGDQIIVQVTARFTSEVEDPTLGINVSPKGLGAVFMLHTNPENYRGTHGPDRPLRATVVLTNRLLTRSYNVMASLHQDVGATTLGESEKVAFFVTSDTSYRGMVDLEPQVQIEGQAVAIERGARIGELPT